MGEKGMVAKPGKSSEQYLSEARSMKTKYGDKCCDSNKHQTKGAKKK